MADPVHLDTNFLIFSALPQRVEAARIRQWTSERRIIRLSAIAWAEFQCGPVSERAIDAAAELAGKPIAFSAMDAILAGRLFNVGGRRRNSLPDCMIAATALNAGASLATNNVADFERFVPLGLNIETP